MKYWATRDATWAYLNEKHPLRIEAFNSLLDSIDHCIDEFEARSGSDTYARLCGFTLIKAKNLAMGSFSLLLDGLGQEAGALLRPMIEYIELLTYFRHFPDTVEKAAENELPKAGERAKAINGIYHELRKHLNEHASHSSYSHHAFSHLLTKDFQFRKAQEFVPHVIDKNFTDLVVQVWLMLYESALTLERLIPHDDMIKLAASSDHLKEKLINVFELEIT